LTGVVVSDKMDKTVVVAVTTATKHGMYSKTIKVTNRYKAHDEKNQCGVGDKVSIEECRPLSKEKRWNVAAILEKAPGVSA
jgi:small subunit ribosomal protein S17